MRRGATQIYGQLDCIHYSFARPGGHEALETVEVILDVPEATKSDGGARHPLVLIDVPKLDTQTNMKGPLHSSFGERNPTAATEKHKPTEFNCSYCTLHPSYLLL